MPVCDVVQRTDELSSQTKKHLLWLLLVRLFNTTFVGVDVLGDPQQTNFGRDIVFSADLCYNDGIVGRGLAPAVT